MVTGRPLLTLWAERPSILHKIQTFTGYSPVFIGIVPKVPEIFLSGTFLFSVSSQKHSEPTKDTNLKHLTLKTAFLLALASGKRRSKIHAWVANKVCNLGQWEKIVLFPSPDFIANNQLAREGSQSVSPVTIPALTTIVDRQFKEDRKLCPVRALRYCFDRTKDWRWSRSLLFISFKKRHTSDIRPATLSSWFKQPFYLDINKQTNNPWTCSKLKSMTLGPSRPLRLFTVGIGGPDHASLSLESSQHIHKFLPKRPYLVRQRQQYVSGTSGIGTTSPRSFPSDQLSSEGK